MRKPVTIDLEKCGPLYRTVIAVARYLPFDGKVEITRSRLVTLRGAACSIIEQSLAEYRKATLELFGKEDYTEQERAAIDYLKRFYRSEHC